MTSLGVGNTTAWLWIGEQDDGIKIFSRAATDSVLGTMKLFVYDDPVSTSAEYPPNAPASVPQYLMNAAHVQGFHNAITEIRNIFTDQYYAQYNGPSCYANPYVYDAVWLLSKSMILVGNNATKLKSILPYAASDFVGVTGPLQFDANGDSLYTNYATYRVSQFGNGTWYVGENGFYNAATAAWQPVSNGPVIAAFGHS
jgi:ABC-type branched-subunit amino acid transport system substrate-binding protein